MTTAVLTLQPSTGGLMTAIGRLSDGGGVLGTDAGTEVMGGSEGRGDWV
ncbi:hypothetical protein PL921420007 [Planktothrix tepida PCC 9214]|uniref:Uncharacterized protein n=1 Tax=Planktothrix tepida PCC 9214 TaxID=671072 RepID=A0A1J1LCZ9_9CYAN|nr:hypothetical protein PL921420007 [Planktothrix tepida PCC 9214]